VAWQCDEDAYNAAGQKCSAQSILFAHANWADALYPKLAELAARRRLDDLTVGPILSWTNDQIRRHIDAVLAVDGARLLFGGNPLTGHTIPDCFGAWQPTAIEVPLAALDGEHFELLTTELFGPFQVVTTWQDEDLDTVLSLCERMQNHLTAAVVSADVLFQNKVLGATVNGTTYCGMRARTTGAPQNHWFGPSGDPRGAGIGTPEAIQVTWSAHREIIADQGPAPSGWSIPPLR
jgi:1-pyrroline-5-carboxylate dehydrogenase